MPLLTEQLFMGEAAALGKDETVQEETQTLPLLCGG